MYKYNIEPISSIILNEIVDLAALIYTEVVFLHFKHI